MKYRISRDGATGQHQSFLMIKRLRLGQTTMRYRIPVTPCIETHDCFSITEYAAIEHFGLAPPGEGYKRIEDGSIELGGRCPVNPSGGLIGCGHPVGATGARQLLDTYLQVSGKAGEYQVDGAKRVATLNIGGSATTNVVHIIGRDA